MPQLILYHGSPMREFTPVYGKGEDRHDYGRGFYLTENVELAKEWAVCRPDEENGWVHKYSINTNGLRIVDFRNYGVLTWLAELMKHRDASDSRRYHLLASRFIDKYAVDTADADIITGWRADASYFYIAKEFVRDNIDITILEELLSLGDLGIQYCLKSAKAFSLLEEIREDLIPVSYAEFNPKYTERDMKARERMRELVNSDRNPVIDVFSTII
jgi:hypothetical protein